MGLVTEHYLSSAPERLQKEDPVESLDGKDCEGVVEDSRSLLNLATGLHPDSDRTYRIKDRGRTITVSEDDILYERSNT